jgi:cytochrome b pre-mRNA-processing protein 3
MNIFAWFNDRRADKQMSKLLYEALLMQARQPKFYLDWGVSDTADGRFDLITLHAFIVMNHAKGLSSRHKQMLFDFIFKDLDRACREMGFGDLSVPRHMKRMMQAFKGRYFAYEQVSSDRAKLKEAILRNVYRGKVKSDEYVESLTNYVMQSIEIVGQVSEFNLKSGQIDFAPIEENHEYQQLIA